MAARKSTNKKGTAPAEKEPAPPKLQTWRVRLNQYEATETIRYTNALTADDAFTKIMADFRTRHPRTDIININVVSNADITFVP